MKRKWNISALPVLILGCGGLSSALWRLMLRFSLDSKGLLVFPNLPGILVLLITLAVTVAAVLFTYPLDGSNRYADNFGPSPVGGITAFAAAAATLLLMLQNIGTQQDLLSSAWLVLGFLSVPAMALTGLCHIRGKRPNFLFHSILCAFFGIHMANQYRFWSSDPQMAHYFFRLFACAGLALTAYYHAAFDVGMGRRRRLLAVGMLTAYCCMVALGSLGLFYPACGLWAAANLCRFQPQPRRPKPAEEPPAPEGAQP